MLLEKIAEVILVLKAAGIGDALDGKVYPIYQAGDLIMSAAMSAVFFKEKITFRCVVGLTLAFLSILLIK